MSYLVRPKANGKGFRVIEETYTPVRKVKTVPLTAYAELGFRPDMGLLEAKERASQINAQAARSVVGAARRLETDSETESIFLPKRDVERFEQELAEMYADSPYRHDVTLRYWRACQLIIKELSLDPSKFRENNSRLLNAYKARKWSHDYIKKVTRILNLWGDSVTRARGARFEPFPNLTSVQIGKINEAREDAKGIREAAGPLYWNELKAVEPAFEQEGLQLHWNWMFIATWFGLRPDEVDNLKKGEKFCKITKDFSNNIDVLLIYQPKLVRLAKDKRWKSIPCFFPEQLQALKLIRTGQFKRPLNKTLRRLLKRTDVQVGSPRKAFTDFMLEKGVELEDVSLMLGHQKIDRTWRDYKNKRRFKLPKSG